MNDLNNTCRPWAEPISLLAAGCLSPDEEQNVRQHIDSCSRCRKRFHQLTELCGAIVDAQLPAERAETTIAQRVISTITSESVEMVQPQLLSRSLDKWRKLMRSPVSRFSAAAIVVLTVTAIGSLFFGGGATRAFADFAAPIIEAKTARFKLTTEIKGKTPITSTGDVMVLDGTRTRQELVTIVRNIANPDEPIESKSVMIFDWKKGKSLTLTPSTKTAVVISLDNLKKEQIAQQNIFASFRSILLDVQDKPELKREPLGEKEIGGQRVIGFRVNNKGMKIELWGDPKTGLPVRAETTMSMFANAKSTMSDFVFNVEMEEELFSINPPKGYTVQNIKADASPIEEKDLIVTFREYQKISGGAFPDSLDMRKILEMVGKHLAEELIQGKKKLSDAEMQANIQKSTDSQLRIQRGLIFAVTILPPEADAHYDGRGVSFGDANTPIFWYRPNNSKTYRVIYADLSVRDEKQSPNATNAQKVSVATDQKS